MGHYEQVIAHGLIWRSRWLLSIGRSPSSKKRGSASQRFSAVVDGLGGRRASGHLLSLRGEQVSAALAHPGGQRRARDREARSAWFGVFAPKGVPAYVVEQLNTALRKVVSDPATVRKMTVQGAEPKGSTPAELSTLRISDLRSWKAVVNAANIPLD